MECDKRHKNCVYCGVGFNVTENFYKHLTEKHGLPIPVYPEKKIHVMSIRQGSQGAQLSWIGCAPLSASHIGQLVAENVNRTGRKLQLVPQSELLKPTKIKIFLRLVTSTSLPRAYFLFAFDRMLKLFSRSLHRVVV